MSQQSSQLEQAFRQHFEETYASAGEGYQAYAPAYRFGREYAFDPHTSGDTYDMAKEDLRARYELHHPGRSYDEVEAAVRFGFERGRALRPETRRETLPDHEGAIDKFNASLLSGPDDEAPTSDTSRNMAVRRPQRSRDTSEADPEERNE